LLLSFLVIFQPFGRIPTACTDIAETFWAVISNHCTSTTTTYHQMKKAL